MDTASEPARISGIDVARFYAIALVFYGHLIEEFMLLQNAVGAAHYKFVYSFHMVLFIVLAGYVARESEVQWPVKRFLKHRFFSRFLPFVFFTVMMMIPAAFFEGKFFGLPLPSVSGYLTGLTATFFGLPFFCVPSWFLLLIIGVELLHYTIFRFLKLDSKRLLLAGVAMYLAGYLFTLKVDLFNPMKGRVVGWNYFFIHEAVVLYPFYLIGIYLRRRQFMQSGMPAKWLVAGGAIALTVVGLTYDLNHGPFRMPTYDAVVIMMSSHGHILLFPLTAAAGCTLVLCLAGLTPNQKLMAWMGQNTLILMCLNGIFYHYINPPAARFVVDHWGGTPIIVSAVGVAGTLASLTLCMPLVWAFNRYVPQLVGKPKRSGPLFNRFLPQT